MAIQDFSPFSYLYSQATDGNATHALAASESATWLERSLQSNFEDNISSPLRVFAKVLIAFGAAHYFDSLGHSFDHALNIYYRQACLLTQRCGILGRRLSSLFNGQPYRPAPTRQINPLRLPRISYKAVALTAFMVRELDVYFLGSFFGQAFQSADEIISSFIRGVQSGVTTPLINKVIARDPQKLAPVSSKHFSLDKYNTETLTEAVYNLIRNFWS